MATSEFSATPASASERFQALAETAFVRLAAFWRAARNRRSVAKLLEWDERALRDIGLTPGDVRSVMALPAGEDPSTRLGVLSVERRAALRAEARERLAFSACRPRGRSRARLPLRSFSYPFTDL
jgi:uncharacterized protein YjiS (DUF1127 family)